MTFSIELTQIEAVAVILTTVGGALFGVHRLRPRKTNDELITSYIDDESHEKIEERNISLYWGKIFFLDNLTLRRVAMNATYEVSVRPITTITKTLTSGLYDETIGILDRSFRTVRLNNRSYFKREGIDEVTMVIRTPVGTLYRESVHLEQSPMGLTVVNENRDEVRNYRFTIPAEVAIDKLTAPIESVRMEIATEVFSEVLNKKIRSFTSDQLPISAVVKSIPGRKGANPGEVTIPLASAKTSPS